VIGLEWSFGGTFWNKMMKINSIGRGVFLMALCLEFSGCSAVNSPETKRPAGLHSTNSTPEYRLQLGDEIEIKFFLTPELNQVVVVRPDGKISLELIDEARAEGLTPIELDEVLTAKYRGELRDPQITVIVKKLAAKVYVAGEVRMPKYVSYNGSLTALQAVFEAGGFTETAEPSSAILLRRVNGENGDQAVATKLDLKGAIYARAEDIALLPSDIIFIPKSTIAEVNLFVDQYIRKVIPLPFNVITRQAVIGGGGF